jgi:Ca-activated chloride channel family protein
VTAVLDILGPFHFLRPAWLLGIPASALLWWLARRLLNADPPWAEMIAPHLAGHLTINRRGARQVLPGDITALCMALISLVAAGPAWERVPNPFFTETAPLVIALEVSHTMLAGDVQPTRLDRAKMKILDLIGLRAGARTGLVAYAGSAHLVLPLTDDPKIMAPFLDGLMPEIMPKRGDFAGAALALAADLLEKEETPGSILFVTDGVAGADMAAFRDYGGSPHPVGVVALVVATEESGPIQRPDGSFVTGAGGQRLAADLDRAGLRRLGEAGVTVIEASLGDGDLRDVMGRVESNLQGALDDDAGAIYKDEGWLLVWPAVLLTLLWFRRGWTMRWLVLLLAALTVVAPGPSQAQSGGQVSARAPAEQEPPRGGRFVDLWLTRDQQGRRAYEGMRLDEAAGLFEDPMWKGVAAYRAGRYAEAADLFARDPTADGLFNMGNALIKAREYQPAVAAFQQALAEDPDHEAARRNLEIAEAIVAYLTRVREQSSTGDQQELGADDYKFDLEAGQGQERIIAGADQLKLESAEQWMRMVDTQPADFLRTKFALEAARQSAGGQAQ